MKMKKVALASIVAALSAPALATNGMNMEGYGPIATSMGGTSFAYDGGTGGMINNPATLGLMKSGTARLDIALGGLHPDVVSSTAGMPSAKSGGDAYYMPAVGYVRKDGALAYGIGMMAQGGMGTEYGTDSFLSGYRSMRGVMGMSGKENRSELGIGRVIFPLAYDVTPTLRLGGSLDFLWGGLDMQMVMPGQMFASFTGMGGAPATPSGYATGSMLLAFGGFMQMGLSDVHYAQFDFSEGGNKMKQRLKTTGWAGNLGFVWQATPQLSIGGVYHAKTSLDDMEGDGRMNMQVVMNGQTMPMTINGRLRVVDFQWPETWGLGLAYQASPQLMIAADYKRINWSKTMKDFRMAFTAQGNAGMLAGVNGTQMDAVLRQNWDDQDVFMIGAAYRLDARLTLRAGLNLASNPVPSRYMHPLFPATIKNHVTLGAGYAFNPASSIDFSLAITPRVTVTNDVMGVTTSHRQQHNWQLMYSHRF